MKPRVLQEPKGTFLAEELAELEALLVYSDSINTKVSKASVGWQIDHSLLTISRIYQALDTSNSEEYKSKFNIGRSIMFTFNRIPRGRAEAPATVRPQPSPDLDSIKIHLNEAKQALSLIDSLNENAHFTHPLIGMLNRKDTKLFLKIHTNHHLKIIGDVLNK